MIRKLSEKDMNEISEIWLSANLQAHDFVPDSYWTENLPFVKEMLPKAEVYVYKDEERKETDRFEWFSATSTVCWAGCASARRRKHLPHFACGGDSGGVGGLRPF